MICLRLYGRFLTPGAFGVVVVALTILNYLPLLDGGFRLTVNRLILAGANPSERLSLLQFYQKLQLYIALIALLVAGVCMTGYWRMLLLQQSRVDVVEVNPLLNKLQNGADPVSKFVWSAFPPQTQAALSRPEARRGEKNRLLVNAIENLLKTGSVYEPARFAAVTLSPETQGLLKNHPQARQRVRLNRLLLEDAFPAELARKVEQPLAFFLVLAAVGALAVGSGLQSGLLVGLQVQEQTFILTALNAWLNVGVLWICLRAGLGLWAFPAAMLATMISTYALAIWLIVRREPALKFWDWRLTPGFWNLFREHRRSAWDCFCSQVLTILLYTVDLIFVEMLCGQTDAGVYALLSRVFTMLRSFLLSSGEVTWPMVAQKGVGDGSFQSLLTRGNAWMYGSVAGPLCVTLLPFCRWYVGESWTTSGLVLALMTARFVVNGLSTPSAYVLYGLGRFKAITRCLQRELIAGAIFTLVLGTLFQLPGITVALLIATAFGMLYPIVREYALATGDNAKVVFVQMWWRGLAGFICSLACATCLLRYFPSGWKTIIPAALGVLAGLLLALLVSFIKNGQCLFPSRNGLIQLVKGI